MNRSHSLRFAYSGRMSAPRASAQGGPPEERRLRRDAQRNRERVLTAARQLFAERGLGVTLDDVAAAAGVGVGTVYRRYANKDALVEDLFTQRIEELVAIAESALAQADAWEAFVGFLERMTEVFAEDRALAHIVVNSDRGPERIAHARERLQSPVGAIVERARAHGRLRPDFDGRDLALVHAMLATVVQKTHDADPELWRRYLTFLVEGLATRSS